MQRFLLLLLVGLIPVVLLGSILVIWHAVMTSAPDDGPTLWDKLAAWPGPPPASTAQSARSGNGNGHSTGSMLPRVSGESATMDIPPLTPEELVDQALRETTPQGRIEALRARTLVSANRYALSQLCSAMSRQYLTLRPPALLEAQTAAKQAEQYATTPEDHICAGLAEVEGLLAQGLHLQARDRIGLILWDYPDVTEEGLELRVKFAGISEEAGNLADAELAYRDLLDVSKPYVEGAAGETYNAYYRTACLRLLRIYRAQKRIAEVDALIEQASAVLQSPIANTPEESS